MLSSAYGVIAFPDYCFCEFLMSLNTASEAATMSRQFLGLSSLSDRCWRAHTLPDPEAFFSTSRSISKQKSISSSSSPGLPFQELSRPGNSDVSAEGRMVPKKAPNHCVALQQQPRETFKSKSSIWYHCSPSCSYNLFTAFKSKNTRYILNETLFLFFFFSSSTLLKFSTCKSGICFLFIHRKWAG